ncbi:hypothetical protein VTL71DRAFT_15860 [Oculimacula yallundae]|uniref:O-methyltransferase C-terminal domain-containing protein n=1 Tax=Oculimacula yallundae TaxID=86028 RepID=A0ABR4CCU0_9HELO
MDSAAHLLASLEKIGESSFTNEEERLRVRDALFTALRKVQSPWDIVWEYIWVSGATNASVTTLIDAGVFKKWAENGGGSMTCTKLAELTGADEQLIKRLMRQISGQHLITEIAEDTFAPTTWSLAMGTSATLPNIYGEYLHGVNIPIFASLPYFLKDTGFKNPTDLKAGNWQYKKSSPNNFFQDLAVNPGIARDFHCAMECHSKYNLTSWTEVYPTEKIIEAAKEKPDRPLVVDIGGSKGYDLEKFRLCHPDIGNGSLVLQDLPDVVQDLNLHPSINIQAHNFFDPQPVIGARVYYMHNVLHDWPDETAISILRNVVCGLEKGYSRLLVHESLIQRVNPEARVTVSDIAMMACLAAKERTEVEWCQMLEGVGLRIVKIWRPVKSVESVIEAELA